jgi:hypothetical protein
MAILQLGGVLLVRVRHSRGSQLGWFQLQTGGAGRRVVVCCFWSSSAGVVSRGLLTALPAVAEGVRGQFCVLFTLAWRGCVRGKW